MWALSGETRIQIFHAGAGAPPIAALSLIGQVAYRFLLGEIKSQNAFQSWEKIKEKKWEKKLFLPREYK